MMDDQGQLRRSTHQELAVSYAAVGASQAPDLLKFPPHGSTPFEHEIQLGSGEQRFLSAAASLMTWGAQRSSGITVTTVATPAVEPYAGVTFTDGGVPHGHLEHQAFFAPDGTPYLEAGTTVRFEYEARTSKPRELRVISTIEEDRRVGFVVGITEPVDVGGEECFTVELRPDDTVWAMVRGFLYDERSKPAKLASRNPVNQEIAAARDQIVALTPAIQASFSDRVERDADETDGVEPAEGAETVAPAGDEGDETIAE